MPNLARMVFIGQNVVNPLCSRFKPTNTLSHKKFLLTNNGLPSTPSSKVSRMSEPATIRTIRSAFMIWNSSNNYGLKQILREMSDADQKHQCIFSGFGLRFCRQTGRQDRIAPQMATEMNKLPHS